MSGDQLDLFGDPIPALRPAGDGDNGSVAKKDAKAERVEPAVVDSATADIAALLSAHVHLRTSSRSFPGWTTLVYASSYPDTVLARRGVPAYAAHPLLRTVGIDRTFYAPIGEADFRTYATQARASSAAFRFLVKAPMLFTGPRLRSDDGRWADNEAFRNASLAIAQFVVPATRGLAEMCRR